MIGKSVKSINYTKVTDPENTTAKKENKAWITPIHKSGPYLKHSIRTIAMKQVHAIC